MYSSKGKMDLTMGRVASGSGKSLDCNALESNQEKYREGAHS